MNKYTIKTAFIIVLAILAGWAGARFLGATETQQAVTAKESTFDRIMRTRTIRCGYFVKPPFLVLDPNTGQPAGLFVDIMNSFGAIMDLKIEWSQELVFGTYLEDLANGRYDMECAAGWPNANRGQYAFYAKPYAYVPLIAVVRTDDHRFDADPSAMNDPNVRISTVDGSMAAMVRNLRFPKSQNIGLPQTAAITDATFDVVTGKSDVTFDDVSMASVFIKKNPGVVRIIRYDAPLFLVALSPTLPPDIRLKQMVDVATEQLLNTGKIEQILRTYETEPGQFLRVALPFHN